MFENDLIIKHLPTEYYDNGNVKAYASEIKHLMLNKSTTVRHKNHEEYTQRFNNACKLLRLEWTAKVKNDHFDSFANRLCYLQKYLPQMDYNKNTLLREIPKYAFSRLMPKQPYKTTDMLAFEEMVEPTRSDKKYLVDFKWYHLLILPYVYQINKVRAAFIRDSNEYQSKRADYTSQSNDYNRKLDYYNTEVKKYNKEKDVYDSDYHKRTEPILSFNKSIESAYEEANTGKLPVASWLEKIIKARIEFITGISWDMNFESNVDSEDETLTINFVLPHDTMYPDEKDFSIVKTKLELKAKKINSKELTNSIKTSSYAIYISVLNDIFQLTKGMKIYSIVLNGYYSGLDRRTGKDFTVCIMTSKVQRNEFDDINLDLVEPKECFKYLKGKGVPNPDNIVQIEPLRFVESEQYRLIDSDGVLLSMSSETNLATMDWRDFETLIREVFELEFSAKDIEIRNTQHSNDGGIDVIAFDKCPYSGGIIVLQAKRYSNTVIPDHVRALQGTMQNFNAIRGILVTTADFGSQSREIAGQNNITLINGDELIHILKKHGYEFHIDLKQAKMKEDDI